MSRSIPSTHLNAAIEHLRKKDRRMRKFIDRVGPCLMKRDPRHFTMLARSIVSQQNSTIVARAFNIEVTHHELEFPILAFACWIRLMLHRRNQQNNSSG